MNSVNSSFAVLHNTLGNLDWGSVPEWFGAAATSGAVIVALWVARRDGARLEQEQREAKNDREAYLRELEVSQRIRQTDQARQVLIEVRTPQKEWTEESEWRVYDAQKNGATLRITNHSLYPIYDVRVGVPSGLYDVISFLDWDSLPPGTSREATLPPEFFAANRESINEPTLRYIDARGNGWLLDRFGILRVGNNRMDFVKHHEGHSDPWPDA